MKYLWIAISIIMAYMAGASGVAIEEYQFVLHWVIIISLTGGAMGFSGALAYLFYLRGQRKKLAEAQEELSTELRRLASDRAAFEISQKERSRKLVEHGNVLMLELTEEEKRNALGKQLRHIEEILHQQYKKMLEELQAENHRLRQVPKEQVETTRKKVYTGSTKSPKKVNRPGLIEGPEVKKTGN